MSILKEYWPELGLLEQFVGSVIGPSEHVLGIWRRHLAIGEYEALLAETPSDVGHHRLADVPASLGAEEHGRVGHRQLAVVGRVDRFVQESFDVQRLCQHQIVEHFVHEFLLFVYFLFSIERFRYDNRGQLIRIVYLEAGEARVEKLFLRVAECLLRRHGEVVVARAQLIVQFVELGVAFAQKPRVLRLLLLLLLLVLQLRCIATLNA